MQFSTRKRIPGAVISSIMLVGSATASSAIEEIVVTAEHREASMQDTQISLSALSAESIDDLGISNGSDIGEFMPNVTITPLVAGRAGFGVNMRGMGNNETIITFDPAVGMYVDGVLIPKNVGGLLDVLDLERIEVLRGPQGTLYGRNTMGGTLNFITKKPTDQLQGKLKATVGNYQQRDLRAMLNLPLLDSDSSIGALNMRVSAATLSRDGLTDNLFPDASEKELGTKDRDVALIHLLWEPSARVSVGYSYDVTRIDEVPDGYFVTSTNTIAAGPLVEPFAVDGSERPDSISANADYIAMLDVDGQALNISYAVTDSATFHSLTGYREMRNIGSADSDGTPLPLLWTDGDQSNDSFSQEFRLVGSAFSNKFDYSLGLFYMDQQGLAKNGARGMISVAEFENDSWAVYGQGTWYLNDQWNITAGARYTDENQEMLKLREDSAPAGTIFPKASASYDNFSPMISVGYNWHEDVMTYFKISTGFQSGGFNVRDTNPQSFLVGVDEETLIAYEFGLKATSADQRFRLNAALWYSDYQDKALNVFNPVTLGNQRTNAGIVEIVGWEIEFLANLTPYLQTGLDWGATFPEFVEYDDPVRGDLTDETNFPYTPKHDVHAFLSYEYPNLDFGVLQARLDYSFRDAITFLAAKPEYNSGEEVSLWNARVSLKEMPGPGRSNISVSAWIKNLTDESYWTTGVNIFNTFGFDINLYGEPRTFGVDLAIEF